MELRGRSHYICVQEDITERKRDEAPRQQLAREVEAARAETESERRRLYQLFNEAPAGIALLRGPSTSTPAPSSSGRPMRGECAWRTPPRGGPTRARRSSNG
ncbi:hypothetical protein ACN28S_51700 [Cystobacter fuscus]